MKGIITLGIIFIMPFLLFGQNDYRQATGTAVYEIRVEEEQIFKDSERYLDAGMFSSNSIDCKELGLSFIVAFKGKKGSTFRVKGSFESDSVENISLKNVDWKRWNKSDWSEIGGGTLPEGEFFEFKSDFMYFKIEPGMLEHKLPSDFSRKLKARLEFRYEYLDF